VKITVGGAGTGDGFRAFCAGETQISDASYPIEAEEQQACADKGIKYIALSPTRVPPSSSTRTPSRAT
jgi:phosphate transport system substrate-binding protein